MSQNIALTLTLGGTQKAVSNVGQLEEAIRQAKEELRGVEIGSTAFNKLASDVKIAENRLKDLNKQVEGKDLEARIGDFGKLGGAVGASFASATAAIQLFGGESEDSLKAVTQAQNALTLALGAKAAAEGAYVVKQYASIAATKLQTIATNTLNASTRAFFVTLLSNPLTLVLAGLSALAIAMYGFGDSAEEASTQVSDLNAETKELAINQTKARQSAVAETSQLVKFRDIVNDSNKSLRVRRAAYEELQKLVPTLKNLTLEQAQAEGVLNGFIQDQITLINLRAQAKALEEVVTKQAQDALEEERKSIERLIIQRGVERADFVRRSILGAGSLELANKQIKAYDDETARIRGQFNPKQKLAELNLQILEIQGKQTEIITDQTKAIDKNLEAEKRRADAEAKKLFTAGLISKAELEALLRVEKFQDGDVEIIKELEKKIATQEKWISTLGDEKTRLDNRDEVLVANRRQEDDAYERFVNYTTAFKLYIQDITKSSINTRNFAEEISALGDGAEVTRKGLEGLVNPETLATFDDYVNNLNTLAAAFNEIGELGPPLTDTFGEYTRALADQNNELLTNEQRSVAAVKAIELLLKARDQFIAQQKAQGSILDEDALGVNFDTIAAKITDATVETNKFEQGVLKVKQKVDELNNVIDANAENTTRAFNKKTLDDFITGLQEGLQNVQAVLGAFQQTFQQSFDFQFDLLEKRYKRITEGIIGDSEESKNKRIEAERAYQAERERLEKQAAKTQLRISLAQSIANTAEAITRVFAQTGIGGIIAGSLVAAASAANTVTIAQQLAAIDSYQRGGIMRKRGGGLVTGNSHEFGGVKFQGGGVELEGNEAIINRVSTINYMGLLDQINQAGGGAPISSAANESRLIEAIAKQRNTPIRAYVVESDITAKQETARRLETLSQF
jgi:hypothetical protein